MHSMARRLCPLSALPDPGSTVVELGGGGQPQQLMLLRKAGRIHAYLNSCPHTGGPLDWLPGVFLDTTQCYVQCATHDALFRIEDGLCVHGPCVGESLQPVAVTHDEHYVYLAPPPQRPTDLPPAVAASRHTGGATAGSDPTQGV